MYSTVQFSTDTLQQNQKKTQTPHNAGTAKFEIGFSSEHSMILFAFVLLSLLREEGASKAYRKFESQNSGISYAEPGLQIINPYSTNSV